MTSSRSCGRGASTSPRSPFRSKSGAGAQDVLVPAAHGAWLADHVPGATVVVEDGRGHLSDLDQVVELTSWLVKGT